MLELIGGPMLSGKSSLLLQKLSCDYAIGKKVLYINHTFDTRGDLFSTHNPLFKQNVNIPMIKCSVLPSLNDVMKYDTLGVDEFNFFDHIDEIKNYVDIGKKRVIVAGLVGDYKREKFGHLIDLIPICDQFDFLKAKCIRCAPQSIDAPFTFKTNKNNTLIDIGGADKYIPLCREHYLACYKDMLI
ncbi:MAG TPA: hypothetical protein VLG50_08225 [Candidatus Saccharimonadales bacterium]|nr:hypothetical protein [Candidatus Saccharimonadales bacterium]